MSKSGDANRVEADFFFLKTRDIDEGDTVLRDVIHPGYLCEQLITKSDAGHTNFEHR